MNFLFIPKSKIEIDFEYPPDGIYDAKHIEQKLMEAMFSEEGLKKYKAYKNERSNKNNDRIAIGLP